MTDLQIVEGLLVQPGDTLLIRVDPDATADYVHRLKKDLAFHLPEHVKVVVVAAAGFALAAPPDEGHNSWLCGAFEYAPPGHKPARCTEPSGHDGAHRATVDDDTVAEWAMGPEETANRRTLPATPTYTDADVELVGGTLDDEISAALMWCETKDVARAVLSALVAAGRLLPAGGEVRQEWGVLWAGDSTPDWGYDTLDDARFTVESAALDADDTATFVHRLVITTPPEPTEEQP